MTEKKLLWIAIAAGVVAVACVEAYVTARETKTYPVIVAKRDLPAGHVFEEGDLRTQQMPSIPDGALSAADSALVAAGGAVATRSPIRANAPVYFSEIASAADIRLSERLSERLPKDKRAISIPVSGTGSVANMIRPGDEVEILVTRYVAAGGAMVRSVDAGPDGSVPVGFNTVVEKVKGSYKVLAVGASLADVGSDPASYGSVTLEVTPEEAITVAGATSGQLNLTLLLCGRKQ